MKKQLLLVVTAALSISYPQSLYAMNKSEQAQQLWSVTILVEFTPQHHHKLLHEHCFLVIEKKSVKTKILREKFEDALAEIQKPCYFWMEKITHADIISWTITNTGHGTIEITDSIKKERGDSLITMASIIEAIRKSKKDAHAKLLSQ